MRGRDRPLRQLLDEPSQVQPGTFAYLVWDDDALYYAGSMTDTELRSFGTKRNDHLWNGDVFELFLKPSADRPEYYEFQANPRGVVFEAPFPKRGHDFGGFANAPLLGSKAVVALKGTLDQPGDRDEGWSVEGRIPWSAFAPSGGKPKPGSEWLFAICRYDYGKEGTEPVTMSSAPLTSRASTATKITGNSASRARGRTEPATREALRQTEFCFKHAQPQERDSLLGQPGRRLAVSRSRSAHEGSPLIGLDRAIWPPGSGPNSQKNAGRARHSRC